MNSENIGLQLCKVNIYKGEFYIKQLRAVGIVHLIMHLIMIIMHTFMDSVLLQNQHR